MAFVVCIVLFSNKRWTIFACTSLSFTCLLAHRFHLHNNIVSHYSKVQWYLSMWSRPDRHCLFHFMSVLQYQQCPHLWLQYKKPFLYMSPWLEADVGNHILEFRKRVPFPFSNFLNTYNARVLFCLFLSQEQNKKIRNIEKTSGTRIKCLRFFNLLHVNVRFSAI